MHRCNPVSGNCFHSKQSINPESCCSNQEVSPDQPRLHRWRKSCDSLQNLGCSLYMWIYTCDYIHFLNGKSVQCKLVDPIQLAQLILFETVKWTCLNALFNCALHSQFHLPIRLINLITPSKTARNLGVVIDDKLNFTDHITKTARSCRFTSYNIKKIRPFLSEHATQLLVQALILSRLDYCNALLAGLPASSIKPLQLIQNATARLIFNEPKITHVTFVHQFALATNNCSH